MKNLFLLPAADNISTIFYNFDAILVSYPNRHSRRLTLPKPKLRPNWRRNNYHNIHSFILAISIAPFQVLYYTQRRSRLQHWYCIGVSRRSAQATAQRRQSGLKTGGRGYGWKNFDVFRQFHQNNQFFRANIRKIPIFSGNFTKNFDFSRQIAEEFRFLGNFTKNFDFFRQFKKNSISRISIF